MPSRRRPDAYSLLGLEPGASRTEIRRAYRRLALEVHPDIAGGDTTAQMAALNEARDELLSRTPGRRDSMAQEPPGTSRTRPRRPREEPSYSHSPTWDDYWSAWNDPPRRGRA